MFKPNFTIEEKIKLMRMQRDLIHISDSFKEISDNIESVIAVDGHVEKDKIIAGLNFLVEDLAEPADELRDMSFKLAHIRERAKLDRDIDAENRKYFKKE